MRIDPVAVQKVGSELAIAWSDGQESFLDLERLRRSCPCAACQGEPDVLGRGERPAEVNAPGKFELLGWQSVGGYALQPRWGDGHQTGLYSYALLRHLSGVSET